MTMTIGPRSEVRTFGPARNDDGTSRRWSRVINGTLYDFTAITNLDHRERRYFVSKRTSVVPNAWTPVHSIIVPAPRAVPPVGDPHWVDRAVEALAAFEPDLTDDQGWNELLVRQLLDMWRHRDRLTSEQVRRVVLIHTRPTRARNR